MKKIVRLTESDLVHLVKRVIKEQPYRPISDETIFKLGFKKIDKIGIWVMVEGKKVMTNVFAKKETTTGCEFLVKERPEDAPIRILDFDCTHPTKVQIYGLERGKVWPAIISNEAGNRLINGCGCKDYVRTDMTSSGQDYV